MLSRFEEMCGDHLQGVWNPELSQQAVKYVTSRCVHISETHISYLLRTMISYGRIATFEGCDWLIVSNLPISLVKIELDNQIHMSTLIIDTYDMY